VLVVHAGNRTDEPGSTPARFAESAVPAVTERVNRLLTVLQPRIVVSAPAAGADLLVLATAQQLGIPVHVLLPLPHPDFEARSVADRGERWVARFHAVVNAAASTPGSSLQVEDLRNDPRWYQTANGLLVEAARQRAREGDVVALTIRPTGGEHPPSVTDEFATRAQQAGFVVMTLDPRPGHLSIDVG
jgi:hypothetical protein